MTNGTFLFLGTGASTGIPVISCKCPVCTSIDPLNKRLRPSALVSINGKKILIDTGPDFRAQALKFEVNHLDGVIITHTHYDHISGIDELRIYYVLNKVKLPVLVSAETLEELKIRYYYIFREKKKGGTLTAQLDFKVLEGTRGTTDFVGIPLTYVTYEQGGMLVNGFRFGDIAYLSDIRNYPDTIYEDLKGVKTLIISALHHTTSHMHFSFDEAIEFSKKIGPQRTYFTHIAHDTDHQKTNATLPSGFKLAYDGLTLEFQL